MDRIRFKRYRRGNRRALIRREESFTNLGEHIRTRRQIVMRIREM